jgi:hypothetical protein
MNFLEYCHDLHNKSKLHKSKVTSIEDITTKLISYSYINITNEDIYGCTEDDILMVEKRFGKLPILYKNIMMRIGKNIKNVVHERCDFYLSDLYESNCLMRKENDLSDLEDEDFFPENAFFIYNAYSGRSYFILTNKEDYDAPVFVENGEPFVDKKYVFVEAYSSIWDWIDDYLENKIE